MDLLVATLCQSASTVPVAVGLMFEQILGELARFDAQKLVHVIAAFAAEPLLHLDGEEEWNVSERLLSLHVMAASIRFMTAAQLLKELAHVTPLVLPSLSSALVDLRKAAIFVLVEMFLVVGNALQEHLRTLSPPQRKLLTIYVERKMKQRTEVLS